MKLKLRYHSNSLFFKYILSYIVVFLMPFVLLGGTLCYTTVNRVRQETETDSRLRLERTAQQLDNRLGELRSTAASVSYDSRLSRNNIEADRAGDVAYNLSRYKAGSSFIDEILVYYKGQDSILTTKGRVSLEVFASGHYEIKSLHGRPFPDFLNDSASYPTSAPDFEIYDRGGNGKVLFFNFPLPPGTRTIGSVVCVVQEKALTELLGAEDSGILLFDYTGNRIVDQLSDAGSGLGELVWNLDGASKLRFDGKKYHVTETVSDTYGWRLAQLTEYRRFYRMVSNLRNSLLLLLLLIQVCGILLVVFQAKRSVKPIHGILSKLAGRRVEGGEQANEIDLITTAIDEAVEENAMLKNQIGLQYDIIRDRLLLNLLYARVSPEERGGLEATLSKDIASPVYCVLLFSMIHSGKEKHTQMRDDFLDSISVYNDGINLLRIELLQDNDIAFIAVMDNNGYLLEMQRELASILSKQARRLALSGTIGVGKIYAELEGISKSFVDAKTAAEYHLSGDGVSIELFDDIADRQDEFTPYPLKEKMLFKQSVRQGNREVAQELLAGMTAEIEKKEPSLMLARVTCMELVNALMELVRELGLEVPADILKNIMLFESMGQFVQSMTSLIDVIVDYVLKLRSSQNDMLVTDVLEYIRKNMESYNLSLAMVADEFCFSTTYLSRLIKQSIGYTFTDYLVELRLDEAKRLLRETDLPVREIVSKVGYVALASFTRKFKLKEGKTPGQFRRDSGRSSAEE